MDPACRLQELHTQAFPSSGFSLSLLLLCINPEVTSRHERWLITLYEGPTSVAHSTWLKISKGFDREGVPESITTRLALLATSTQAVTCCACFLSSPSLRLKAWCCPGKDGQATLRHKKDPKGGDG